MRVILTHILMLDWLIIMFLTTESTLSIDQKSLRPALYHGIPVVCITDG